MLIDGNIGEGGGQILRTALGLSMVTGTAFQIENIRAKREKPGLLRQHLTCVNAAAAVCGADVDGAVISSTALSFSPGPVKAGEYKFSVGSAGSTMLVLQAILPALVVADGPSTVTLEGGMHNPFSPPIDFLTKAFLPLLNRTGPAVAVSMERAGFYPAGGGRAIVTVARAAELKPLHLLERGDVLRRRAVAVVAGLPGEVAKRELAVVARLTGWSDDQLEVRQMPDEWGPGNLLSLEIECERVTEVFTGFGMKRVTAEAVAHRAVEEMRRYLATDAPVGEHLADQLLIPLAMAGEGSFRTTAVTTHTTTNMDVIARFCR